MLNLLLIFVGGGFGSLARYAISKWLNPPVGGFPWGTLTANVLACLVLGIIAALISQKSGISKELQALVLIGFCGGFSTFSTFSIETLRMIQNGQWMMAIAYVTASLITCLLLLAFVANFMKIRA
jgi:CrcB protein